MANGHSHGHFNSRTILVHQDDMMKLFLIFQKTHEDYDTYDSAIVAAPDEETARDMNPRTGEKIDWVKDIQYDWCYHRVDVQIKYLGETELPQGVICASFNAG